MLEENAPEREREKMWRSILADCDPICRKARGIFGMIPALERCKNCHAPLSGSGAVLMRQIGRGRYEKNPRFCNH